MIGGPIGILPIVFDFNTKRISDRKRPVKNLRVYFFLSRFLNTDSRLKRWKNIAINDLHIRICTSTSNQIYFQIFSLLLSLNDDTFTKLFKKTLILVFKLQHRKIKLFDSNAKNPGFLMPGKGKKNFHKTLIEATTYCKFKYTKYLLHYFFHF